jgi:hypothetical protein
MAMYCGHRQKTTVKLCKMLYHKNDSSRCYFVAGVARFAVRDPTKDEELASLLNITVFPCTKKWASLLIGRSFQLVMEYHRAEKSFYVMRPLECRLTVYTIYT